VNAMARARRPDAHILLVGNSSTFAGSYEGIGMTLKQAQTGFLIGGRDYDDMQVVGINVPHAEATQALPPGQGYYARRKRYVRVKVAEPPSAPELNGFVHADRGDPAGRHPTG
jgi:hypothetical protein